jgi:hypothetical protein
LNATSIPLNAPPAEADTAVFKEEVDYRSVSVRNQRLCYTMSFGAQLVLDLHLGTKL